MTIAQCKHCNGKFSPRGIKGHIRFKHGVPNPEELTDFMFYEGTLETQEKPTHAILPVTENTIPKQTTTLATNDIQIQIRALEENRAKRRLKVLEDNELLAIQIENKRMRDDLAGVIVADKREQRSELDTLQSFLGIQKLLSDTKDQERMKVRNEILEEIGDNSNGGDKSAQDVFFETIAQKIGQGMDISKAPTEPVEEKTVQLNSNENVTMKTDEEILSSTPEYVKQEIINGNLAIEEVKAAAAQQKGIPLTDPENQQMERLFKKVKGDNEKTIS